MNTKLFLMICSLFIFNIPIALSQSPKSTEEALFPACMVHNGVVDPDFIKQMYRVSNKIKDTCFEDADPRWKAKQYLINLRDFALHAPQEISNMSNFLTNSKQNEFLSEQDKKSKIKAKKNSESLVAKGFLKAVDKVPEVGKIASEIIKFGIDGGMNSKISSVEPGESVVSSFNDELTKQNETLQTITDYYKDLHDNLNKLISYFDNPEGYSINTNEQKFLRSIVCKFSPKMKKSTEKSSPSDLRFDQFCSDEGGPGNFNSDRGEFTCKEIDSLSVGTNRDHVFDKIKATFARSLSDEIIMPDPYKILEEGTPARFEIELKRYKGEEKDYAMGFRSPGGIQLICTILRDPSFDKFFTIKGASRKLNLVDPLNPAANLGKSFLKVKDLGLPVAVSVKEGNVRDPEVTEYFYDKSGKPKKISINDHKSHDFEESGMAKLEKKQTEGVMDYPVTLLLNHSCDR